MKAAERGLRGLGWAPEMVLAGMMAVSTGLEAAPISVTVSNYAGTALGLYNVTDQQWVNTNFCANPEAPVTAAGTDFSTLDSAKTYTLLQAGGSPSNGHSFKFSSGRVTALAVHDPTTPFFKVSTNGGVNRIDVKGVPVTFHLVSSASNAETFYLNEGSQGTAALGGSNFMTQLVPGDGNFDGVYSNIQFRVSGSSAGVLTLGTEMNIAGWSGPGHSFERRGPRNIAVTTDRGVVFEIAVGPLFFEAEAMGAESPAWAAAEQGGQWYSGWPSGGKTLWGYAGGQGTASNTVAIEKAGTYRVWVRYVDQTTYRGPFKMAVYQNGGLISSQIFDQATTRTGSTEYAEFVWGRMDAALVPGNAQVVFTKEAPVNTSGVTRYLDCVAVTPDLNYEPDIQDFVAPLYMKAQMGTTQTNPCVIHVWGRRPTGYPSWWLPHCNLWQDGIRVNQYYSTHASNPADPNLLTAGEETPWVNIAPLLDSMGVNRVQFYAMQDYPAGLASAEFTVKLSSTPSDEGLFRTYSRAGGGSGQILFVDLAKRDQIKSDREYSDEARARAAGLGPTPGKRPVKFPVITSCQVAASFYSPECVSNELAILSTLGFNDMGGYDPVYYDAGFSNVNWSGGRWDFFNDCLSNPNVTSTTNDLRATAQSALDKGVASNIVVWKLMDEPGSESFAHILGCHTNAGTNCHTKYTEYLTNQPGLTPGFFGKAGWADVVPTTNKASEPRGYYYTARFRNRILTDVFKLRTSYLNTRLPGMPTMANFAEESTFYGNALLSGADWFEVYGPQEGLRLGWTEDWLSYSVTKQLTGYRATMMRAACRSQNRPFGMYNIWGTAWDVQAKPVCDIGRGVTRINQYAYGPYYTLNADADSLKYDTYAATRAVNYAIGAVEEYLAGSAVAPSRIALLYSHATDIWTMDEIYSVFGKDRMGLYLLLTHLGYPVDIISEDDVMNNRLAEYDLLIGDGSHYPSNAVAPLVSWVREGGTLCLMAGALSSNEFNGPLNFDSQVGIARAGFVYADDPGREKYELPVRPNLAPVHDGTNSLEAVCGYQKVTEAGGAARVLATFDDGSPAAFVKDVGSGKLAFCGFFPGLGYQKAAMVAKLAWDADTNNVSPTAGATNFPAAYRTFFGALVAPAGYVPPVSTGKGNYLLEASRLEGPTGSVITLVNWTGAAVSNVPVSFARGGRGGIPFTVLNPIRHRTEVNGTITLTMDMAGASDFIVLPQAPPPVSVAITDPVNGAMFTSNSLSILAEASAAEGGSVTQVSFFANGNLLNSDASPPYGYTWTTMTNGFQVLTAVAYDTRGLCGTSAEVNVTFPIMRSWNGGLGNWNEAANWTPSGVPEAGEAALLTAPNAVVRLTNPTPALLSFMMTAGKLVFSNWDTKLSAAEVAIQGGTVTVANAFSESGMSNRVWIACSNDFTLAAPGRIDVSGLGYVVNAGPGKGTPTAANNYGGGGGHGGKGGVGYYNGGCAYDSLMEPGAPGSGGGCTNQGGGGGGVVRIEAGGTATVNGSIVANGQTATNSGYGGGGAGGTICVVASVFTGTTNGLLQANGGNAGNATYGGGGGGGRIAIIGGMVSNPLPLRFSTAPGTPSTSQAGVLPYGSTVNTWGEWGTVYFADTNLFAGMPQNNQFTKTVLRAGSATNWTVDRLMLTNNSFRLVPDGFVLTVAGDLTIGTNAELGIRGSIDCGGSLILTNNGLLTVYSGPTNAATPYGALVNVAGNMVICGYGSWLRPHTDPANGGGVLLRMRNLAITQTNAGINAAGRGFGPGQGPGAGGPSGQYSGGGGYGGSGEKGYGSAGGPTNGNPYVPILPGSGGGTRTNTTTLADLTEGTGFGGGLIRVEASNSVTLEGQLVAQGGRGRGAYTYGAGGAGGGIWVLCRTFAGSTNAVLDAGGGQYGQTSAGSGGGGRIAVWHGGPIPEENRTAVQAGQIPGRVLVTNRLESFAGTLSVTNGVNGGYSPLATPGTVVFLKFPTPSGTVISIR